MRRLLMSALVAPVFALALLAAPPAQAAQSTYQFVGQCTDCTGVGTGTLVLEGFDPDTGILAFGNFVSFTYLSNLLDFDSAVGGWFLNSLFGAIPGVDGGDGDIFLNMSTSPQFAVVGPPEGVVAVPDYFTFSASNVTSFDGPPGWCVALSSDAGSVNDCSQHKDFGGAYTISLVPEPATLALLGAGLVGLGLARRRRG